MQKYTDKNTTPLKYHKFMRYFSLPVTAGLSAVTIIMMIIVGDKLNYAALWLKAVDIVYLAIALVISVIAIIECRKWTPLGWYMVIIYFSALTIYEIFKTVTGMIYGTMSTPVAVGRFVGGIAGIILVLIYYFKRRLLFDGILPEKKAAMGISEDDEPNGSI